MGVVDIWFLEPLNEEETLFTLERTDKRRRLLKEGVENRKDIAQKIAAQLAAISETGINDAIRLQRIKRVQSADPCWYEITMPSTTWRMFCYCPEDRRALVIFALFKSHKSPDLHKEIKNRRDRFLIAKEKYEKRSE